MCVCVFQCSYECVRLFSVHVHGLGVCVAVCASVCALRAAVVVVVVFVRPSGRSTSICMAGWRFFHCPFSATGRHRIFTNRTSFCCRPCGASNGAGSVRIRCAGHSGWSVKSTHRKCQLPGPLRASVCVCSCVCECCAQNGDTRLCCVCVLLEIVNTKKLGTTASRPSQASVCGETANAAVDGRASSESRGVQMGGREMVRWEERRYGASSGRCCGCCSRFGEVR